MGEVKPARRAGGGLLGAAKLDDAALRFVSTTSQAIVPVLSALAVTFKVPPSGRVLIRLSGYASGNVDARWAPINEAGAEVYPGAIESVIIGATRTWLVDGLAAGASRTYRWGWFAPAGNIAYLNYGGSYGQLVMEVHAA